MPIINKNEQPDGASAVGLFCYYSFREKDIVCSDRFNGLVLAR